MIRNIDSPKRMQTLITFIMWVVTYKNTSSYTKFKFLFIIRPDLRVTGTTKDSKNRVVSLLKKKFEIK